MISQTTAARHPHMPMAATTSDHMRLRWPASAIWRPDEPAVRRIGVADLKDALAKGLDDFKAMPSHAIFLVVIYPVIGLVLSRLLLDNRVALIYPAIAGFALVGPVAALGLYELSRRRELGMDTSAWHALSVLESPSIGAVMRLSAVLLAILTAWLWLAQSMYTAMFGAPPATVSEFLNEILTTDAGRQLILVGNAAGLAFAIATLMISVVSFPMLVDRNVSASAAVRTSVRAVMESPAVMMLWGLIVGASLLMGALPLFIGLAVVLPVLGHATWHLYRKAVVSAEG